MKTVTRDALLAPHCVPPYLFGIVPEDAGGFDNVSKVASIIRYLETRPLAMPIESTGHLEKPLLDWRLT